MGKKNLALGDIEFEKKLSLQKSYFLGDVDIEKVLVSKKISFSKKRYKYFTCLLV